MNGENEFSWHEYSSAHLLRLRAACNDAVEASQRPVKSRVQIRLQRNFEAAALTRELWTKHGRPGLDDHEGAGVLFEALVADSRWRTLTIEMVTQEQEWVDLRAGWFASARDRLKAIVEKTRSQKHPFARVMAMATAVTIPVGITVFLANEAGLKVPVAFELAKEADPISMKVTPVDSTGQPLVLPIAFQVKDNVPISFTTPEVPLTVRVIPSSPNSSDRVETDQLAKAVNSLRDLIGECLKPKGNSTATNGPAVPVETAGTAPPPEVNKVPNGPNRNEPATTTPDAPKLTAPDPGPNTKKELEQLAQRISESLAKLQDLVARTASYQDTTTLALPEESQKDFELYRLTGSMPVTCKFHAEIGRITRTVAIPSLSVKCSDDSKMSAVNRMVGPGAPLSLPEVGYELFLDDIDRRSFRKNTAIIRVRQRNGSAVSTAHRSK